MKVMNQKEPYNYLLATYIDGPYFKSALEILLYPSGCSFYRPYSYRKDYVSSNILEQNKSQESSRVGIVGIRFKDSKRIGTRSVFIPLRKLDNISYRVSDGFQVRFRLGDYILHNKSGEFISFDLANELSSEYANNTDLLFSDMPIEFSEKISKLPTINRLPSDIWDRLLKDPNLLHEAKEFINGVSVLQLVSITHRSKQKEIEPSLIEKADSILNSMWGYELEVEKVYDIDLIQRTIISRGSAIEFNKISYRSTASFNRIHLSREIIPQTGNYREEKLWIRPLKKEPAPVFLEWEPQFEKDNDDSMPYIKNALPLRIPFVTKSIPFFCFRPVLFWFGVIFWLATLAFFIFAIVAHNCPNWLDSTFWIALGGICAPLGAGTLVKWFEDWSRHKD